MGRRGVLAVVRAGDDRVNRTSIGFVALGSASAGVLLLAASGHYAWSLDSLLRAHFGNWTAANSAKSAGQGRGA